MISSKYYLLSHPTKMWYVFIRTSAAYNTIVVITLTFPRQQSVSSGHVLDIVWQRMCWEYVIAITTTSW